MEGESTLGGDTLHRAMRFWRVGRYLVRRNLTDICPSSWVGLKAIFLGDCWDAESRGNRLCRKCSSCMCVPGCTKTVDNNTEDDATHTHNETCWHCNTNRNNVAKI